MSEQPDIPMAHTPTPNGYADWLVELKSRIYTAQQRATLAVNRELVLLYWQIGHDILTRQARAGWGSKVIEWLAYAQRAIQHGWSRNVWWLLCRKSCKPACPASNRLNVN